MMDAFKPALHRKFFIDRKIREKNYPNASTLARDYKTECGKYVNARTIAADIAEMRDELGAPLHYDAEKRGYVYTNPAFTLDFLKNESADVKNLFAPRPDTDKIALSRYHETMLTEGVSHDDPLSGKMSVIKEENTTNTIFTLVRDAIAGNMELDITYKKSEYKAVSRDLAFAFHPCHLVYTKEETFVFGAILGEPTMPYALLNLAHIAEAKLNDAQECDADYKPPDSVSVEMTTDGEIKAYVSQNKVDSVIVFTRLPETTEPEWVLHSRTDVFFNPDLSKKEDTA